LRFFSFISVFLHDTINSQNKNIFSIPPKVSSFFVNSSLPHHAISFSVNRILVQAEPQQKFTTGTGGVAQVVRVLALQEESSEAKLSPTKKKKKITTG
jgi:hypothetical protein